MIAADAGVIFFPVKPERTADFEKVMAKLHEALAASEDPVRKQQAAGWKVFKAVEPGPNNTVLYVFLIDPAVKSPQALILAPTRELALQVAEACVTYSANMPQVNVLPIYGGQAYDCTIAIALAAQAAGSTDPSVFVDQMIPITSEPGTKCSSFAECSELLAAGDEIDYDGPSGPIAWAAAGADPAFATYEVWQIDDEGGIAQIDAVDVEL